jgi:hypothetical protein
MTLYSTAKSPLTALSPDLFVARSRKLSKKAILLSPSRGRGKVRGCGFKHLHPHPDPLPSRERELCAGGIWGILRQKLQIGGETI